MIAGIDYGSKLAGTTSICYNKENQLYIIQSQKKSDADALILNWVEENSPTLMMLDAPLSLPKVYTSDTGTDFHYRACDRELKAMSPMFLGGLTARAMKLRAQLSKFKILETYPKQVRLHRCDDIAGYKDDVELYALALQAELPFSLSVTLENWHQVDSVLAWLAGWYYSKNEAIVVGDVDEGLIYF